VFPVGVVVPVVVVCPVSWLVVLCRLVGW